MKKGVVFISSVLLISGFLPMVALASTLSCSQVDGQALFGYDGSDLVYIGAIGNEFSADSIANEFGAGNEFSSTSIFNDYGTYGGEFSSASAFNDFATNPPIIVSSDYKFLGYMTLNDGKFPFINTYEAIACAKESFQSPDTKMEDISFKKIPGSSSLSTYVSSGVTSPAPAKVCSSNSVLNKVTGECECITGYRMGLSSCLPYVDACHELLGPYSIPLGPPDHTCVCQTKNDVNSDGNYAVGSSGKCELVAGPIRTISQTAKNVGDNLGSCVNSNLSAEDVTDCIVYESHKVDFTWQVVTPQSNIAPATVINTNVDNVAQRQSALNNPTNSFVENIIAVSKKQIGLVAAGTSNQKLSNVMGASQAGGQESTTSIIVSTSTPADNKKQQSTSILLRIWAKVQTWFNF